jgi:hypothetical protein
MHPPSHGLYLAGIRWLWEVVGAAVQTLGEGFAVCFGKHIYETREYVQVASEYISLVRVLSVFVVVYQFALFRVYESITSVSITETFCTRF